MPSLIRPLALASIAIVIGVTAVAVDSVSAPDAAAAADPGRPRSSPSRFTASSGDPTEFWNLERMSRATPMDVVRTNRKRPKVRVSKETGRKAQRVPGVAVPGEQTGRVVQAAQNQPSAVYPYPFGRRGLEQVLNKVAPYRAVGRVFFRFQGGLFSCSGASVTGGPRHVVFTAGHCLNDGLGSGPSHWATDVIFVPARRPGKSKNPYGSFAAKELWVPAGWSDNQWFPFDIGAFNVAKNQKSKPLRKSVGALGFAYNEGRVQHFDMFGYPAAPPFGGNRMIACSTQHAVDDADPSGPDPIGVGCDMTGGSSGGPWILRLRRGNLLNGVTSFGYSEQPHALYSPYFDGTANNLRCAAATGNPNAQTC